jgi:hypothetical protein
MYAILRRRSNGRLECVIPKVKRSYPRTRGMTPILARFKETARHFRLRPRVQNRVLRGSKGHVEPRVDYCSTAPRFETVRNGLVALPTWTRVDFEMLLSIQYSQSPRRRHLLAAYAFQQDGTLTPEYAKPLAIYARSRPELVERYKDRRLRMDNYFRRQGPRSSSRTDTRTSKTVLPTPGRQMPAIGSRTNMVVQKQVTGSIEGDNGEVSDTEDEGQARDRFREPSKNLGGSPWAEIEDEQTLRTSLKRKKETTLPRLGLSPDPQRTKPRGWNVRTEVEG